MTVTLVALDGSLLKCEVKALPRVIVFVNRAFVRRGEDSVYYEQVAEQVWKISKPKELGENERRI